MKSEYDKQCNVSSLSSEELNGSCHDAEATRVVDTVLNEADQLILARAPVYFTGNLVLDIVRRKISTDTIPLWWNTKESIFHVCVQTINDWIPASFALLSPLLNPSYARKCVMGCPDISCMPNSASYQLNSIAKCIKNNVVSLLTGEWFYQQFSFLKIKPGRYDTLDSTRVYDRWTNRALFDLLFGDESDDLLYPRLMVLAKLVSHLRAEAPEYLSEDKKGRIRLNRSMMLGPKKVALLVCAAYTLYL
uniref:Uncharacterized protein n=1 Tax=Romanomermis culicivorax TaxID=13658 RepID=A0A915I3A8_ROMCU